VWQIPDAVDTVVCAPDDGWKYHPKHVEQFPDIDKLCNVASCWIYEYIGILLGAHPILHISRVNSCSKCTFNNCCRLYLCQVQKTPHLFLWSSHFQKLVALSVVQTIWNLTLRVPLSTDTGLFFFFFILIALKPFLFITYWRQ